MREQSSHPHNAAPCKPAPRFPDLLIYRGYSAPVRIEGDVYDLEVDGEIPSTLNGAYFRASADPQYPPRLGNDIFLNGDGMTHMVRIEDGHADLKMRYVRTEKFKLERAARRALFGAYRNPFTDDPSVQGKNRGTANTSICSHAGRLFALKEDSQPMELNPSTLETIGPWDFDGVLRSRTFTAHPKIDPVSGEMMAFAYNSPGRTSNIIEIYWISKLGQLTRTESFEAPYASMVHDWHVSPHYVAFTIYPMINDWERVKQGLPYFHWDSSLPTVIAIIPRREGVRAIRWYKSPVSGMATHSFNAWEEGHYLHLEQFFTASGWLSQFPDLHDAHGKEMPPYAQRWTFDLGSPSDAFTVKQLFDQIGEMPMIDQRYQTQRARHYFFGTHNKALGPMLEWGPKGPPFTCLGHFDENTQRLDFYYAGPESAPEEPLFIPRSPSAPEGDGWLLSMVGRRKENRTDLVILDARHIDAGPVATIRMPCRLHEGFHGTWIPQDQLAT
jgi:carotenoid cleavage dioxygenase-like enzyme